MKQIVFILFAVFFLQSNASSQGSPILWRQTQGPTGGLVTSSCIDSNNNLYVSTQVAGFFRSSNNGDTWVPHNRGLRRLQGKQIVSDGGQYVFAITYYNELIRLHDLEIGWEYLSPFNSDSISLTLTELAANQKGHIFVTTGGYGVLRSTDHGDSWHQVGDSAFRKLTLYSITVARNGDIYAVQFKNGNPKNYIYRSTDDGMTWSPLPKEIPNVEDPKTLAIAHDNSIILGTFWGLVYRSSDGGNSWVQVFEHPNDHNIEYITRDDHGANKAMYLTTHSNLYANVQTRTGGFYRSTNNGATWELRDGTEHGESKFYITVDKDGDVFHTSVPYGIIKSTDQGSLWFDKNNGLLAQFIDGIVVNKEYIYAVSQFLMYRSSDNGDSWITLPVITREAFRPPFLYVAANNDMFHASYYGLFRSQNYGNSWTQMIFEDTTLKHNLINDFEQASNGDLFALSSVTGLMVSKNGGSVWEKVPNLHPDKKMTTIACGPNNEVLCSDDESYFWLSKNGGVNWENISSDNNGCSQLTYHPSGAYIARFGLHTDISYDNGKSWKQIFPYPNSHYDSTRYWIMYSHFIDRNGGILVTTDSGIYRSKEAPYDTWEFVSKGITAPDFRLDHFTNVSQLAQDKTTGVFYAGSRGQSVYKSIPDLGAAGSRNEVETSALQNYPNPFASRTMIPFAARQSGRVTITLTNVTGSFERVITDEYFLAGKHEVLVDARELPAGTYVYHIEYADGKREANKMIIMK